LNYSAFPGRLSKAPAEASDRRERASTVG